MLSNMLRLLLLIPIIILLVVGLIALPYILEYVDEQGGIVVVIPDGTPELPVDTRPVDMQKYYELKNLSCAVLSDDFLIQTKDLSTGSMSGLLTSVSGEQEIADGIVAGYTSEQDTRTYVKGTWMKKVLMTPQMNHTTIWKEGRVYQCNPSCNMNLLGDEGWQEHLDALERIRTSCQEFGKTALPEEVDMVSLITIERLGREDYGTFRCERFSITPNKAYAEQLLASNLTLDNDQRALLWGLAHLDGPMEECLDDGVGLVVWRNLTLDLTDVYLFDYTEEGGMWVDQFTELEYYDSSVPDSFFSLPS